MHVCVAFVWCVCERVCLKYQRTELEKLLIFFYVLLCLVFILSSFLLFFSLCLFIFVRRFFMVLLSHAFPSPPSPPNSDSSELALESCVTPSS